MLILRPANLPKLIPKPNPSQKGDTAVQVRPACARRRVLVLAACNTCRSKKIKCDGTRPRCTRCHSQGAECKYEVEPGDTHLLARKRKYEKMERDLDDLHELYTYLQTRSEMEVAEIIRRIRTNRDPAAVLRFIKDADLLLEASMAGYRGAEASELRQLDADALRRSSLKVIARPWTVVAGDGIVSELVSKFFAIEQPSFGTFVDETCFLQDMRSGIVRGAKLCSPFLVNAICAFIAFTSSTVKAVDRIQGGNLREAFHQEARKQFDLENGKSSLTTALAAYITCLYFSHAGKDRAGALFRFTSYEMLKRINLGKNARSEHYQIDGYQRAESTAAWGLFCQECLAAFAYMRIPMIKVPELPRIFQKERQVDQFLAARCNLSEQLYEILSYNNQTRNELGGEEDIKERLRLYRNLLTWKPPIVYDMQVGQQELAMSLFSKAMFSTAAIGLFRPLESLEINLPNNMGTPRFVCAQHSAHMIVQLRTFEKCFPHEMACGFSGALYICYVVCFTLLGNLNREPSSQRPFTEACRHLFIVSRTLPVATALLKGIRALALQLKVELPEESLPYFKEAFLIIQSVEDVPISYVIPQHAEMEDLMSDDGNDTTPVGVELGKIIAKWSAMSL